MGKSRIVDNRFSKSEGTFIPQNVSLKKTKTVSENSLITHTEQPVTSSMSRPQRPGIESPAKRKETPTTEKKGCLKAICNLLEPPNYHIDDKIVATTKLTKHESNTVNFEVKKPPFNVKHFRNRPLSFYNFNTPIAPVFTCFKNDRGRSLELDDIPRYAAWLKRNNVCGVLVNSHIGEVNTLSLEERKRHLEEWCSVAKEEDFICMVEIGAPSIFDAIELARHAVKSNVHAVFCNCSMISFTEDISKTIMKLQSIANNCSSLPFFYTHEAEWSQSLDLLELCERSEAIIPNFLGVLYIGNDLNEGLRCIDDHRAVFLSTETLMGPGLILGFHAVLMAWANVNPKLCKDIILAISNNDLAMLREKQRSLCADVWEYTKRANGRFILAALKGKFNEKMLSSNGARFSAGPTR